MTTTDQYGIKHPQCWPDPTKMDTKDLLRYVAAVLAKRMRMLAEATCGKCGKPSVGGFVIPTGLQPSGQRTVLSYCDEHKPSQDELAKSLDPDAIHILPPDAEAWLP